MTNDPTIVDLVALADASERVCPRAAPPVTPRKVALILRSGAGMRRRMGGMRHPGKTEELAIALVRAWRDAASHAAEVERLRAEVSELRRVSLMVPSQRCAETHFQACSHCDRLDCGDNTSEAKHEIERLRARAEKAEAADGPTYPAGRLEGRADVCAQLRAILDPNDAQHLNLDGLLRAVERLARWRKLLEAAPGEAAEIIRERTLSGEYLAPIVASWREAHDRAVAERFDALAERDAARAQLAAAWAAGDGLWNVVETWNADESEALNVALKAYRVAREVAGRE